MNMYLTDEVRQKALQTRRQRKEEWANLDQKREWLDADHMRESLHRAGLAKLPPENEPPTISRIRTLTHRMNISGAQMREAIGLPVQAWVDRNPKVPMWVLLAHLVEMIDRPVRRHKPTF